MLKAVETATEFLPMSKSQGLPSRFSVTASLDGAIANFDPLNQPAKDFSQETPLPSLQQTSQTQSNSGAVPAAKFTVVFAPNGVLEVNP